MEFHEKLQELRKQKGLTQNQLAERLFVSRTAVSKWESGRGYPNIESLKAIAKFFGLPIDQLLSGEELLALSEEEYKKKENWIRDLIFGLLDLGASMLLFLPFFGQMAESGTIQGVLLFSLNAANPYLKAVFYALIFAMILLGIATLALQNCKSRFWLKAKASLSLFFHILSVVLFVITKQPYAATFLIAFLIVKLFILFRQK